MRTNEQVFSVPKTWQFGLGQTRWGVFQNLQAF
jgi:hypothetical protein